MYSDIDTQMMARALQLARRGRYSAMPNPHVGCVLVRDGKIIGEGFTQAAGGNHAEVEALACCAGSAAGATAYVTLEPCSHQGKTGPCASALIGARVGRVVAAMEDPNPLVSGRGLEQMRTAGIDVQCGLLESEARREIPGFIARMSRGRPRVRAKLAMSVDGRTAMASGESQWITGPAARQDVQRLRAMSCAIVTGVGTVLADDCSLKVRPCELGMDQEAAALATQRQPLRAVLDSQLRTPPGSKVLEGPEPAILFHTAGITLPESLLKSADRLEALPLSGKGLDLTALVDALCQRHCNEILVESGPRLAGAMLQQGLLDELIIYMAPSLMGSRARPLFDLPLDSMSEKVELTITEVRKVGADWRFTVLPMEKTG
jgi:diaminohydroxyphosphoribosylaminopyrimidine deaminase / 5-amino-6-(5-phosphoribosylamino)uracil reductase